MNLSVVFIICGSVGVCAALTGCVRRYALQRKVLDIPNVRSSHTVPTPRGGGLAVVLTFAIGVILLAVCGVVPYGLLLVFLPSCALVAGVGALDDYRGLAAGVRIIAHIAAVLGLLLWLGGGVPTGIDWVDDSLWLSFGLSTVALVWVVNVVNFMDGIDGLAAMETCFVLFGLLVISQRWSPFQPASGIAEVLAGATAGFLMWNLPPARIFMGDVGSGFLGFLLGALCLVMVRQHVVTLWVPVILLGAFLADATVTLCRRMIRGERWYAAHRSHAYQWLSRRWNSHGKVTVTVFLVDLLWLGPLAWMAQNRPVIGPWLALTALTPVVVAAMLCGAGRRE